MISSSPNVNSSSALLASRRKPRIAIATNDRHDESANRTLHDTAGHFTKNYGIDCEAVLLIRPDGYVASIATHDMLTATMSAITAITPPKWDHTGESLHD